MVGIMKTIEDKVIAAGLTAIALSVLIMLILIFKWSVLGGIISIAVLLFIVGFVAVAIVLDL